MTTEYRMIDAPARPQRVSITWRMETAPDDSPDRPDERDDGFWPSRDPKAAGYVKPEEFDAAYTKAFDRMAAWENGEWEYIGVMAVAHVSIPVGGGSFVSHTFTSAGLWGVESDAGDYLREVFEEEKRELMAQLRAFGEALASGDFDQRDA